jgi:hypothetical protein
MSSREVHECGTSGPPLISHTERPRAARAMTIELSTLVLGLLPGPK